MDYSEIRAIIGEPDAVAREAVRSTLWTLGFRKIADTPSLVKLHQAVRRETVNLIIFNSSMDGDDTTFITREIRAGKLGSDPFVISIVLIADKDASQAKFIANSGADGALLFPISSEALVGKITSLSGPRKPFVVTHDYIGPERRAMPRPGSPSAKLIDVPNPLVARSAGDAEGYTAVRDIARIKVFSERTSRLAAQLEWLAGSLRTGVPPDEDNLPLFHGIEEAGRELVSRTGGNPDAMEAVNRLLSYARLVRAERNAPSPSMLDELHALANGVAVMLPSSL